MIVWPSTLQMSFYEKKRRHVDCYQTMISTVNTPRNSLIIETRFGETGNQAIDYIDKSVQRLKK